MKKNVKSKFHILFWTISFFTVLGIGVYYFPKEYKGLGFLETLYFTMRLFVFEHDFSRFPDTGALIFIHFAAPLLTLSAVGTAVSYLLRYSPAIKTRYMKDHVIVCGLGRTGRLFVQALMAQKIPVVGIDIGPPEAFDAWMDDNKHPIIFGNFHHHRVLEKAGAERARSIIFASGNDLLNLEGALAAYEWLKTDQGAARIIWAQIANEQLADTARTFIRTHGKWGIRYFDAYRIAVTNMLNAYFGCDVRQDVNEVNILGYGKFGRDLLDVLLNDCLGYDHYNIRVIDIEDREEDVMALARDMGAEGRVTFQQSAIQHLKLVDEVDKAFFVCTDDDLGNLIAAMNLARKIGATHIYVRMTHWPLTAVAECLGRNRGVFFVNIKELTIQGIKLLPGIFGPAELMDLKYATNPQ